MEYELQDIIDCISEQDGADITSIAVSKFTPAIAGDELGYWENIRFTDATGRRGSVTVTLNFIAGHLSPGIVFSLSADDFSMDNK